MTVKRRRNQSGRRIRPQVGSPGQSEEAAIEASKAVGTRFDRHHWWLAVCLLAILAHLPALWSGFLWDDIAFVDTWLPCFDSISALFWPPSGIPDWPEFYYRPLGVLTLKLDSVLWGSTSSLGWHTMNLMLHCIICCQVYSLSRHLLAGFQWCELSAKVTSAVFAVHPIHVESVNWIAGRSDPLATLFTVTVIQLALKFQMDGNWTRLVGVAICLLLGLLCKEVAIVALPLSLMCMYATSLIGSNKELGASRDDAQSISDWIPEGFFRKSLSVVAGASTGMAVYVVLRFSAGAARAATTSNTAPAGIDTVLQSIAFYIQQMTGLLGQTPVPPADAMPGLGLAVIMILLTLFIAFAVAVRLGKAGIPIVLGVAWFFVSLAPSLVVVIRALDRSFLSERYLYLPSIGFCLAFGAAVGIAIERTGYRKAVVAITSVAVLLLATKCVWYGTCWVDNLGLWQYAVNRDPNHARAWVCLGAEYERRGQIDRQLVAARHAFSADPTWPDLAMNLALVSRASNEFKEAEAAAAEAVRLAPDWDATWLELGIAKLKQNQSVAAEKAFYKALELNPMCAQAHVNLALLKERTEAIEHLNAALSIEPNLPMALNNLGVLYAKQGARQRAIECFQRALGIQPGFTMAVDNLAAMRGLQ